VFIPAIAELIQVFNTKLALSNHFQIYPHIFQKTIQIFSAKFQKTIFVLFAKSLKITKAFLQKTHRFTPKSLNIQTA
jgi:hypothetical protein